MPSTALRHAVYDPQAQVLTLTFVTGRRYRYLEVPAAVAEGLQRARSKGGYFNTRIRDRFEFEELGNASDGGGES
jgi:KTSC domain-containing protein